MTREGVLAAVVAVSVAVLGWHWWPEPVPAAPPEPPRAPRTWSGHELRVCREMTARATLDGPVTPFERERLGRRAGWGATVSDMKTARGSLPGPFVCLGRISRR